ncbi:MAG: hypothetical protein Q8Q46_03365 [Candidatus Giovannonibacteria bacterium]|nr:hypothetical protein [Candidatus Giovannonibacteria bacterium]
MLTFFQTQSKRKENKTMKGEVINVLNNIKGEFTRCPADVVEKSDLFVKVKDFGDFARFYPRAPLRIGKVVVEITSIDVLKKPEMFYILLSEVSGTFALAVVKLGDGNDINVGDPITTI